MQFKVRRIFAKDIKEELCKVGFSQSYIDFAANKHRFLNIKIYNLSPIQATIIKETALSSGADSAVHKGVLDHSVDFSDIILSGTVAQIQTICEKLGSQQFSMGKISSEILKIVSDEVSKNKDTSGVLGFEQEKTPLIMGILNVTEDSFSDGGKFLDPKKAIEQGLKMIDEGAKIIDIGAESTRPGAEAISPELEIERITPVIKKIRQNSNIKISIDTRNSDTARVMADLGADIINDVSGLNYDKNMAKTVKESGISVVIMHTRGTPKNMENFAYYKNTVDEVYFELYNMVQNALRAGILEDKIIIDPGFGFAKDVKQNFEILSRIEEFKSMGFPVLAGLSRKRFIKSLIPAEISDKDTMETLDNLTAEASFFLATKGADIIRVHNVEKTRLFLNLFNAL